MLPPGRVRCRAWKLGVSPVQSPVSWCEHWSVAPAAIQAMTHRTPCPGLQGSQCTMMGQPTSTTTSSLCPSLCPLWGGCRLQHSSPSPPLLPPEVATCPSDTLEAVNPFSPSLKGQHFGLQGVPAQQRHAAVSHLPLPTSPACPPPMPFRLVCLDLVYFFLPFFSKASPGQNSRAQLDLPPLISTQ